MNYCYKKVYAMHPGGSLYLTNPEPAMKYVEEKINLLLQAQDHAEELKVKLQILREFEEIFQYDLKMAVRPEPFGTFVNAKEKQEFIRVKQLTQDFNFYLGNIFCNFHENLMKQKHHIPILTCPRFVIDYDELYLRAVNEYFGVLAGVQYPLQLAGSEPKNPCMGVHACGTTYILPALIDHFLLMYLQNRMLYQGLDRLAALMACGSVVLTQEEKSLYHMFLTARKHGEGMFNGTQEQTMAAVFAMFIRCGVLEDSRDNAQILVGTYNHRASTLGTIFHSAYAKQELRPEYYNLLWILFDTKNMNIRNCIMHGNSAKFDYLSINVAAVMLQLLWDIAAGDIFR